VLGGGDEAVATAATYELSLADRAYLRGWRLAWVMLPLQAAVTLRVYRCP